MAPLLHAVPPSRQWASSLEEIIGGERYAHLAAEAHYARLFDTVVTTP